jgi:hypothetical protein
MKGLFAQEIIGAADRYKIFENYVFSKDSDIVDVIFKSNYFLTAEIFLSLNNQRSIIMAISFWAYLVLQIFL